MFFFNLFCQFLVIYLLLFSKTFVRSIIYLGDEKMTNKTYLCIDLKSFYASVECAERNLDPFKTDLVVADKSRKGAICLAITPKMKQRGIKNRCRLYEIPSNLNYIIAPPSMKKYISYSANIYSIYLRYFSKEDIHVYSIDEVFIDVTSYLFLYQKTPLELAQMLMKEIYKETKISSSAGIGTNLYLAKVALDIMAKHTKNSIAYLDEETYLKKLGNYKPLSDFWQIGKNIEAHLNRLNIFTMNDLLKKDEHILYKEFGINAKILIDHAQGIEPLTIKDIRNYQPKTESLSTTQTLLKDYSYDDALKVLIEMLDGLSLELIKKNCLTSSLSIKIIYTKNTLKPTSITKKIDPTNSYKKIANILLKEYKDKVNKIVPIRRLCLSFNNLTSNNTMQLSFSKEAMSFNTLEECLNNLKAKYGKKIILRAISYTDKTALRRTSLIGGHNAE